jgi:hypothetical protein
MVLIQMHRGTSLFSRIIRWFSRAPYSHVSVWFVDLTDADGGVVLEAIEGEGVRSVPAPAYREARQMGRIDLFALRHPLTADERAALWGVWHAELGAAYDWLGVFRFVTRRRHAHDAKWFCSEFVAWGLEQIGRPLFAGTEPWEVKPGDVPRSPTLVRTSDPERERAG